MTGGGIKGGIVYGASDDYGYEVASNTWDIHDFQATILNQLGIDHKRLTFRHAGRDYRLTDVSGNVIKEIIAWRWSAGTMMRAARSTAWLPKSIGCAAGQATLLIVKSRCSSSTTCPPLARWTQSTPPAAILRTLLWRRQSLRASGRR